MAQSSLPPTLMQYSVPGSDANSEVNITLLTWLECPPKLLLSVVPSVRPGVAGREKEREREKKKAQRTLELHLQ